MAKNANSTLVEKTIRPYDTDSPIATHDEEFGRGGFRSTLSIAERNAITTERRKPGMLVFVFETNLFYSLAADLVTWNIAPIRLGDTDTYYPDIATGIDATDPGEYFQVADGENLKLYRNNAGTAQLLFNFIDGVQSTSNADAVAAADVALDAADTASDLAGVVSATTAAKLDAKLTAADIGKTARISQDETAGDVRTEYDIIDSGGGVPARDVASRVPVDVADRLTIADAGGYFSGGDAESALQELGAHSVIATTQTDMLRRQFAAATVSAQEVPVDGRYNVENPDGSVDVAQPDGGECPAVQGVWEKILGRSQDVYIVCEGDSTGNASEEFLYLAFRWMFQQIVDKTGGFFTVRYRLYDNSSDDFFATETWQTGSSSYVVEFRNGAVPGANHNHFLGYRYPILYGDGSGGQIQAALILNNMGHNEGYTTGFDAVCDTILNLNVNQIYRQPDAAIVNLLQNPYIGGVNTTPEDISGWTPAVNAAKRYISPLLGVGVIDTWSELNGLLIELGREDFLSTYYDDDGFGVHNNAAGSKIRAAALILGLAHNPKLDSARPASFQVRPSLSVNPFFNDWSASDPEGWGSINATIEKDFAYRESYAYSLAFTCTGTPGIGSPQLFQESDLILHYLRGSDMLFAAFGSAPAGIGTNFGRFQWVTTTGTVSSTGASGGDGYPRWYCARLPKRDTEALRTVFLLGDDGDTGNVDRIVWGTGLLPFDAAPIGFPSITDYYEPTNVVLTQNDAGVVQFPGTLTVSGTDADYTDPQSSQSRFAINLYWLEVGETYEATFNSDAATNATIRLKAKLYGNGDDIGSAQTITAGSNTFSFVATKLNQSVVIIDGTGDDIGTDSWSIVKV